MKKLTKPQRHKLYNEMLIEFKSAVDEYALQNRVECVGFCYILDCLNAKYRNKEYSKKFNGIYILHLPYIDIELNELNEIMSFRPEGINNKIYWFSSFGQEGIDKRIEILEACIELTKPKTKVISN